MTGFVLMLVTIFKFGFFWNSKIIEKFRNKIGDTATGFILLALSLLCIYFGSKFLYQANETGNQKILGYNSINYAKCM